MADKYVSAPSTWLKKALDNNEIKLSTTQVQQLVRVLDSEMLDGLAKHVQEKDKLLKELEISLRSKEYSLDRRFEDLQERETAVGVKESLINELSNVSSERGKDALLFADKMSDILDRLDERAQESLSYIMWAYLGSPKIEVEKYSP